MEDAIPDDLRPWGWAEGHYWINCNDCPEETRFNGMGAKRSYRCKEHAIAAWRNSLVPVSVPKRHTSNIVGMMQNSVFLNFHYTKRLPMRH